MTNHGQMNEVQVTITDKKSEDIHSWEETDHRGNIKFHFDGESMRIEFVSSVTTAADQAIDIDLPRDTDIANLDWATANKFHVQMGNVGTYTRGSRLQSNHATTDRKTDPLFSPNAAIHFCRVICESLTDRQK
jgi:hypothetical protein